jgi:nucleoside-diphosphate-sugar epimerase
MKALVTGGGGFLGRRLSQMLKARGDTVRVFGRHVYPDLERLGVEAVQGDVRDLEACRRACAGVETVFHAAAMAGVWGPRRLFFEINVKGTANILRACLENKVQRLVYTSSPSVAIGDTDIEGADESLPYPRHYQAAYPESKAVAERMILAANGWEMVPNAPSAYRADHSEADVQRLRTCALRPHLIWGPGDPHLVPRIVRTARARRLIRIGNGANRVDITYIDNAAHAHLLAADELAGAGRCAGKAYFIGDAEPVRLWEWIGALLQRVGAPPVSRHLPLRLASGLALGLEATHHLLPFLGEPLLTRFSVCQLARSHWFSHRRAAEDFGYAPLVGPEEGLERLVAWVRRALG